jgi:SAM-dependent methyltransferase
VSVRENARALATTYRGGEDAPAHLEKPPDPATLIAALEDRGRTPSQARLRRRFLRFARIAPGQRVLEVGSGSGVVARDVAAIVGDGGHVVGVDSSRTVIAVARRLARRAGLDGHLEFRAADAARLPFRPHRFDTAIAVTLLLHVDRPAAVLSEMIRVTRAGGTVAAQDQDFGTLALTHPDPALTARILDAVAKSRYAEPCSGRRLPGLFASAGLRRVRVRTDVYQDTTLGSYTRTFLERRAEHAVRLSITDPAGAQRWLDGFVTLARAGAFVMTLNYYGVTGVKA